MKLQRRFKDHFKGDGSRVVLDNSHHAFRNATTIFKSRVFEVGNNLLKSGVNQRKIGNIIVKGKWKNMPIFTLTLEERATCPSSCQHWSNCYGNNMPFSKRYKHGEDLEKQLEKELELLNKKYLRGFVIRLHILGDFYSVQYANLWLKWLNIFQNLHIFGYKARWNDEISNVLLNIRETHPDRWWVRFSNRDNQTWLSTGDTGIICPVQTNQTDCCGTCGLCWTAEKPIKFLEH